MVSLLKPSSQDYFYTYQSIECQNDCISEDMYICAADDHSYSKCYDSQEYTSGYNYCTEEAADYKYNEKTWVCPNQSVCTLNNDHHMVLAEDGTDTWLSIWTLDMPKGMHCSYLIEAPTSARTGDLLNAKLVTALGSKASISYTPNYGDPSTYYEFDMLKVTYTGGLYPDKIFFTVISTADLVFFTFRFWYERLDYVEPVDPVDPIVDEPDDGDGSGDGTTDDGNATGNDNNDGNNAGDNNGNNGNNTTDGETKTSSSTSPLIYIFGIIFSTSSLASLAFCGYKYYHKKSASCSSHSPTNQ